MEQRYGDLFIREATADDAPQLCLWWNDGEVMEHAGFPNGLGTTAEVIRRQLEEKAGDPRENSLHIIIHKHVPIGEMNYREVDSGVCEIGIKICDASMQNKGLGKIVLSLFVNALFNEYSYQKILLDTALHNRRAQHVYERLGFKKIRINENAWKDQLGNLQSSVDYELTRDRFVPYV